MDLENMLKIQELIGANNVQSASTTLGGLVGALAGAPAVGAAIGGIAGTVATSLLPQYSSVRSSMSGFNFAAVGRKPYWIELITPDAKTQKQLSDYYCYYGCATKRMEALNIPNYMYNNHAYVKGDLQYNGTIPMDKFKKIQSIFAQGVHFVT